MKKENTHCGSCAFDKQFYNVPSGLQTENSKTPRLQNRFSTISRRCARAARAGGAAGPPAPGERLPLGGGARRLPQVAVRWAAKNP